MVRSVSSTRNIRVGINTPEINGVIKTTETVVNPIYARSVKPNHVRRLVKNFDPRKIGTIVVCDIGNDKYEIIDGQHRIEVHVLENMPIEERAEFYHSFNTLRASLSSVEKFKARIVEGDGESVVIHEICRHVGVQISGVDTGVKKSTFAVTRAIDKIQKIYHMGVLKDTLTCLYYAYEQEPEDFGNESFGTYIMDNVSKVLYCFRNGIDQNRLIDTLMKARSKTWNTRVDSSDLQMKTYGGALRLVESYNKGLSEEKRLDVAKLFINKITNAKIRQSKGIHKG